MTAVAPCGVWAKGTWPSTTSRRSRVTLWRPCTTCWQAATSLWACTPRRLLHRSSSLLLRPTTSSRRPLCGLLGCADRSQTFRLGLRGIFGCPFFVGSILVAVPSYYAQLLLRATGVAHGRKDINSAVDTGSSADSGAGGSGGSGLVQPGHCSRHSGAGRRWSYP